MTAALNGARPLDGSEAPRAGGLPFDARGERIGAFVIAYNAEAHIARTLSRIPEDVWRQLSVVYVLDDCSTDNTVRKAVRLGDRFSKFEVLRNRVNRRYGGNQKIGYQYAIDKGLDIVVMLHADGQYAPEVMAELLQPLVDHRAEVVLGSRMLEAGGARAGGMPLYKYAGNKLLTRFQNRLGGTKLSEYHSGYRAYRTSFLRRIPLWENTDHWHFDSEILLQAKLAGARIVEVPIPTYYGDEICHVNGLAYGLNCLLLSLRFAGHRLGLLYSRPFDLAVDRTRYRSKFDDPYSSHSLLAARLRALGLRGKQVLELGVGDAALTRTMTEAGAVVDSVEVAPELARLSRPFARRSIVGDLDRLDDIELGTGYDVILAADILEHLVDPETMLSKLKARIKPNGVLLVSLPNVANVYVRVNLLLGRFPYHRKGILDATHLHFYTFKSGRRLLEKTGWVVAEEDVTAIPVGIVFPFIRRGPFRILHWMVWGLARLWRGLFGYQMVFYCKNPNASDLL